jgi:hypothetical protein
MLELSSAWYGLPAQTVQRQGGDICHLTWYLSSGRGDQNEQESSCIPEPTTGGG